MKALAITTLFLIPNLILSQEVSDDSVEKHKSSYFIGLSQGISFLTAEAFSNTNRETFKTKPGYGYKLETGFSFMSKSGNRFSDLSVGYNSSANAVDILDSRLGAGQKTKTSKDRYNFLSVKYICSRYIGKTKKLNPFLSAGIQFSYLLNQRTKVNFYNDPIIVKKKASQISENYVLSTSPTFLLSYGVEFDKKTLHVGEGSRLSFDFTYDFFGWGVFTSPSNHYLGIYTNFHLLL